uniref:Zinc finger protein 91 n=1 Tax=Ceratitis capitata TaxID=7213 RepID=W8ANR0_CERCA
MNETIIFKKQGQQSLSNHKAGRYICQICGKKFVKPSYLQRHNVVHLIKKPFQCSACAQCFTQKASMQRHFATQHNADFKRFKCVKCPLSFSQKSNLHNHVQNVHPQCVDKLKVKFACNQCSSVYNSKHTLHRHINRVHARDADINFNNFEEDDDLALTISVLNQIKSFQIGMNLVEAVESLEEEKLNSKTNILTNKQNSEETSGKAMRVKAGLSSEVKQCYVPAQCTVNKVIETCSKVPRRRSFKCMFCERAFSGKALLQNHLKIHRFDEKLGILTKHYSCAVCGQVFGSLCRLDKHVITHNSTQRVQYKCMSCKSIFKSSRKLAYHKHKQTDWDLKYLQHLLPVPLEVYANHLSPEFGNKLRGNVAVQCTNTRLATSKWQCETCNRLFSNSTVLTNHRRLYHGAYRRTRQICNSNVIRCFKCAYCARFFKTPTQCQTHMLIHMKRLLNTGIRDQTESAKKLMLINAQAIVTEVISNTANKVVKFNVITRKGKLAQATSTSTCHQCPTCLSKFSKSSDLQRHLVVHTGERTQACHLCEKRFGLKSTLKQHLLTHAREERPKQVCIVCAKTYATKKSLNVHLRLHTGVQPFRCEYCELKFYTSGQRISHLRVVHGLQRVVCTI